MNNIEEFFRKQFEGYRVTPSSNFWPRILRNLRWKEFTHFSSGQFNVYYLTLMLAVAAGGYFGIKSFSGNESAGTPAAQKMALRTHDALSENNLKIVNDKNNSVSGSTERISSQSTKATRETEQKVKENYVQGKVHLKKPEKSFVSQTESGKPAHQKIYLNHALRKKNKSDSVSAVRLRSDTLPVVRFDLSRKRGCPPLRVQLINRSKNCNSFIWHIGNVITVFHNDNPEYLFDKPGIYVVALTGRDEKGHEAVWQDTVKVDDMPVARFEFFPKDAVVPEDQVTFYNYSENAVRYFWDFGDHTSSSESEPVHHYTSEGPYNVVLKAWSKEGCVDSITLQNAFENSMYSIHFPNAFIPNPNGPCDGYFTEGIRSNDVFHPVWHGVSNYHLQVFNRFGELIFESNDIHKGWDGYILDQIARPDVYIWKARGTFANGKPFVRFGNITLIKKK